MRKFLLVVLTFLTALSAHAWEATTPDNQQDEVMTQASYAEASVTIAPVPMPAMVVELAHYAPKNAGAGQSRRAKANKVARARSMLSRSAREQIALGTAPAKADERARLTASDDEDDDTGLDDLDLHRSFSQPKLAKNPDQADDDGAVIDLPDHVKLRLLMARAKAVDAYVLNEVGKASGPADEALSEVVKVRLYIARTRALKVHGEKFGAA